MQTGIYIVERNLASIIIQEDSYFTGRGWQHERQAERCKGLHLPVFQPKAPVPPLRAQPDVTLAMAGRAGDTKRPGSLASQIHLPVVSSGADSLSAQDEQSRTEAVGTLRVQALALLVLHLVTIIGHNQIPLGCGAIQNNFT